MRNNRSNPNHRFCAFISYNHNDKVAAKRLHRDLEKIRVSGKGSSTMGKRKSLFPIFIDHEEMLPGTELEMELREHLKNSNFLIVICSTHSSKSVSVNEEIRYFKTLKQGKNIIPVTLEDYENVAFPAALEFKSNESMSLALNLGGSKPFKRKIDRLTLMKIAAPISGVPLHELWSREKRRQTRNNILLGSLISLTLVSPFIYWDLYNRPFTEDFNNFYRSPKGWVGLDKVVNGTGTFYRFSRNGRINQPHEARLHNSSGECSQSATSVELDIFSIRLGVFNEPNYYFQAFCSAKFEYNENGDIALERIFTGNPSGENGEKFLEEFKYPETTCDVTELSTGNYSHCLGYLKGPLVNLRVAIGYKNNRVTKLKGSRSTELGSLAKSALENYEVTYRYDSNSQRLDEIGYYDYSENLKTLISIDHDQNANVSDLKINHYTKVPAFYFMFDWLQFSYDDLDRLTSTKLYNNTQLLGLPEKYFLTAPKANQPALSDTDNRKFYTRFSYPSEHEVITKFYSPNDKPIEIEGVHAIRRVISDNENNWTYHNITGDPAENAFGAHQSISSLRKVDGFFEGERVWYDLAGRPAATFNGVHRQSSKNPSRLTTDGLAGLRLYSGLIPGLKKYDVNAQLIENDDGIAYLRANYDSSGSIVNLSLLDAAEQLVNNEIGIARVEIDPLTKQRRCFSKDEEVIRVYGNPRGSSPLNWDELDCSLEAYDIYTLLSSKRFSSRDLNTVLEETFFRGSSIQDRAITINKTYEYAGNGVVIEKIIDYNAMRQPDFKDVVVWNTYKNQKLIETAYRDRASHERINLPNGYSYTLRDFNDGSDGSVLLESYYDKYGTPFKDKVGNFHKLQIYLDSNNLVTKHSYYEADNILRKSPFSHSNFVIDETKKSMEVSFSDASDYAIPIDFGGSLVHSVNYTNQNLQGVYTRKYFRNSSKENIALSNGTYYVDLHWNAVSNNYHWTAKNKADKIISEGGITDSNYFNW